LRLIAIAIAKTIRIDYLNISFHIKILVAFDFANFANFN